MNRRDSYSIFLLIIGSFVAAWLLFSLSPGIFKTWELQTNDQLFKLRYRILGKKEISPYVVHADLDDPSLRELGLSIDNRNIYGRIINLLSKAGAETIALDMVFPRCDRPDDCKSLVDITSASGRVYYPVILRPLADQTPAQADIMLPPSAIWHPKIKNPGKTLKTKLAIANFPTLNRAAKGIGHITCYPDRDGVFRRFPLLVGYEDGYIPSISFRVVCDYLNVPPDRIEVSMGRQIVLRNARFPDGRKKDIVIPVDEQGRMIINFAGPWHDSFSHYSVAGLLKTENDEELFEMLLDDIEGNLVIVADVSTASRDIGPVPLENFYPLPGIHANIISSILKEDFLREASPSWEITVNMLLAAFFILAALRFRSVGFTLSAGGISLLFITASGWLFFYNNLLLNTVRSSIGILLTLSSVNIYKYLLVEREKALVRARFADYFSPDLLEKIIRSPERLAACEKKNLTILFSDIVGFTSWSATRKVEEIQQTLNEYFHEMAQIVFKYDGTIDKYMGDGLLVFFGDPIEHEDHALRAVKTAIEMQKKCRELHKKWEKEGGMLLRIRIGINTGEVVVGNMGSDKRLEYTVIGANVNLAQRLESNAPHGGILISAAVHQEVHNAVKSISGGRINLKGYEEKFEVFEVEIEGT